MKKIVFCSLVALAAIFMSGCNAYNTIGIGEVQKSVDSTNRRLDSLIKVMAVSPKDSSVKNGILTISYKELFKLNDDVRQPIWIQVGRTANIVKLSSGLYEISFWYTHDGGIRANALARTNFPLKPNVEIEIRRYDDRYTIVPIVH